MEYNRKQLEVILAWLKEYRTLRIEGETVGMFISLIEDKLKESSHLVPGWEYEYADPRDNVPRREE